VDGSGEFLVAIQEPLQGFSTDDHGRFPGRDAELAGATPDDRSIDLETLLRRRTRFRPPQGQRLLVTGAASPVALDHDDPRRRRETTRAGCHPA
jgi:hypothetical protein